MFHFADRESKAKSLECVSQVYLFKLLGEFWVNSEYRCNVFSAKQPYVLNLTTSVLYTLSHFRHSGSSFNLRSFLQLLWLYMLFAWNTLLPCLANITTSQKSSVSSLFYLSSSPDTQCHLCASLPGLVHLSALRTEILSSIFKYAEPITHTKPFPGRTQEMYFNEYMKDWITEYQILVL